MRRLLGGLLAAVTLLTPGCGSEPGAFSEGDPREPDIAGVVDAATPVRITIDGTRYPLAAEISSFSTYTLEPLSLQQRVGQYVHAGFDGDRVVWVATIGVVTNDSPPLVLYSGRLVAVDGDQATFEDGTVLRLGPGVTPPDALPAFLHVRIDAEQDAIASLTIP